MTKQMQDAYIVAATLFIIMNYLLTQLLLI